MKDKKKWLALLPAAAVMIMIFLHSSMDADQSLNESGWFAELIEKLFPGVFSGDFLTLLVRKTAHFLEYLALGLTLRWGLKEFEGRKTLWAWGIGTAYAVTDEIHQMFVAGRTGKVTDVCIDAAGVLVGVAIMRIVLSRSRKE